MKQLYAFLFMVLTAASSSSVHEEEREENSERENSEINPRIDGEGEDKKLNLPLGFRFIPDESDLIEHFLANKILGRQLPTDVIKEIDLYQFHPQQLPISEFTCGKKNEAYFFTYTKQPIQSIESGYWMASGEEVEIFSGEQIVGFKKILFFYEGKLPTGEKTDWKLREYRVNPNIIPVHVLDDRVTTEIERFVVCRIRYKDSSDDFFADSYSSDGEENPS